MEALAKTPCRTNGIFSKLSWNDEKKDSTDFVIWDRQSQASGIELTNFKQFTHRKPRMLARKFQCFTNRFYLSFLLAFPESLNMIKQ